MANFKESSHAKANPERGDCLIGLASFLKDIYLTGIGFLIAMYGELRYCYYFPSELYSTSFSMI